MNASEKKTLFNNAKKISYLAERPPETNRKYVEYKMEGSDDPFKFATDNVFSLQDSIEIMRNVFFYRAIRYALQRTFESGILQHILLTCKMEYEMNRTFKEKHFNLHAYQNKQEYSTLTLNQLYPGFYIWFAASVVSIMVFVLEVLALQMKKKFIKKLQMELQLRFIVMKSCFE